MILSPDWTWEPNPTRRRLPIPSEVIHLRRPLAVSLCLALSLLLGFGLLPPAAAQSSSSASPPVVKGVSPSGGPQSGGTTVTIRGSGLTGALAVAFGGTPAAGFTVLSDTRISALAPPGAGVRDVFVVTPEGISRPSAADFYAYGSAKPPANTSLGSASGVATPAEVTLRLSTGKPQSQFAQILGRWCPLAVVGGRPMAPPVCGVEAFSPATAIWDQAAQNGHGLRRGGQPQRQDRGCIGHLDHPCR